MKHRTDDTDPAQLPDPFRDGRTESGRGWDPYDVWRTRVLAPRLELQNKSSKPPDEA